MIGSGFLLLYTIASARRIIVSEQFNQPLSGNEMPRFSGLASMFRLPTQQGSSDLDVAIIGVPLDIGTSNRTGARYGPRQIRSESVLVIRDAMQFAGLFETIISVNSPSIVQLLPTPV